MANAVKLQDNLSFEKHVLCTLQKSESYSQTTPYSSVPIHFFLVTHRGRQASCPTPPWKCTSDTNSFKVGLVPEMKDGDVLKKPQASAVFHKWGSWIHPTCHPARTLKIRAFLIAPGRIWTSSCCQLLGQYSITGSSTHLDAPSLGHLE